MVSFILKLSGESSFTYRAASCVLLSPCHDEFPLQRRQKVYGCCKTPCWGRAMREKQSHCLTSAELWAPLYLPWGVWDQNTVRRYPCLLLPPLSRALGRCARSRDASSLLRCHFPDQLWASRAGPSAPLVSGSGSPAPAGGPAGRLHTVCPDSGVLRAPAAGHPPCLPPQPLCDRITSPHKQQQATGPQATEGPSEPRGQEATVAAAAKAGHY